MFTAKEIAAATGGKLIGADTEISGVSTDTRTILRGELYVAVAGERFDGADFIPQATEKGAAAVLTEKKSYCAIPQIIVKDARAAQLKLANYHRGKFDVKLCGVTGSVGKTSTKDMIYAVLSARYNTLKTEGNFNNDIGLPRTLFRLNKSHGAAVIEMGMSDLGEISVLSQTCEPNCCVITNIGWCHIENLKTRENILRAKLEILSGARKGAPLILCGDDEYLKTVSVVGRRVISYGFGGNCDIRAENIVHGENSEKFELCYNNERFSAEVPVSGEHHVLNALAAFAVGIEFGMTPAEIIPAFMRYEPSGMRQKIEQRSGKTLILDCYNASPTSMQSSLSVLAGRQARGRKIAVLGDMLELGDMSAQLHAGIAEYIAQSADVCFLYGEEMAHCRDELKNRGFEVYHSTDKQALTQMLKNYVADGDVLLFKGSRGMKMEEIADKI